MEDVKDKGAKPAYVNIIEDIMCGSRDPSYSVDEEGAKRDAEKMYNVSNTYKCMYLHC